MRDIDQYLAVFIIYSFHFFSFICQTLTMLLCYKLIGLQVHPGTIFTRFEGRQNDSRSILKDKFEGKSCLIYRYH